MRHVTKEEAEYIHMKEHGDTKTDRRIIRQLNRNRDERITRTMVAVGFWGLVFGILIGMLIGIYMSTSGGGI